MHIKTILTQFSERTDRFLCFTAKNAGKVGIGVSDDLLAYYENMTKAILGHDEEVTKVNDIFLISLYYLMIITVLIIN